MHAAILTNKTQTISNKHLTIMVRCLFEMVGHLQATSQCINACSQRYV